jgi:hypothetical protein
MMLEQWFASFATAPAQELPTAVTSEGKRDQHLGPRWERARVRVRLEPSTRLEVQIGSSISQEAKDEGYAEAAVMGILDVLMTACPHPVKNVRILVEDLEIDPIDSSPQAFRMAGRDAATRALQQVFPWITS